MSEASIIGSVGGPERSASVARVTLWPSAGEPRPTGSPRASSEITAGQERADPTAGSHGEPAARVAHRYAVDVLCFPPGRGTDALVAAAVARARRRGARRRGPGSTEEAERIHLAVRHEAWRRQRHPARVRRLHQRALTRAQAARAADAAAGGRGVFRVIGPAILIVLPVLAAAWGARTVVEARSDDSAAVRPSPPAGVIAGSVVVDEDGDGADPVGRGAVPVEVLDEEGEVAAAGRSTAAGRFELSDFDPGTYQVSVRPPPGLVEAGSAPGSPSLPVMAEAFLGPDAGISITIILEPS